VVNSTPVIPIHFSEIYPLLYAVSTNQKIEVRRVLNHNEEFWFMTILTRGIMLLYYTPVTFIKKMSLSTHPVS
jgi:hypothetical protein